MDLDHLAFAVSWGCNARQQRSSKPLCNRAARLACPSTWSKCRHCPSPTTTQSESKVSLLISDNYPSLSFPILPYPSLYRKVPRCCPQAHTHTRIHSHPRSYTERHSLAPTHSHTYTHTLTHTLTLTLTHTHTFARSLWEHFVVGAGDTRQPIPRSVRSRVVRAVLYLGQRQRGIAGMPALCGAVRVKHHACKAQAGGICRALHPRCTVHAIVALGYAGAVPDSDDVIQSER